MTNFEFLSIFEQEVEFVPSVDPFKKFGYGKRVDVEDFVYCCPLKHFESFHIF